MLQVVLGLVNMFQIHIRACSQGKVSLIHPKKVSLSPLQVVAHVMLPYVG